MSKTDIQVREATTERATDGTEQDALASRKPEPFNDLNIDSVDGQNAPVAGIRIGCTFCECEIRNPIVREDSIECPTCGTGLIAWTGGAA